MALCIPKSRRERTLRAMLGKRQELHLYANDRTPGDGDKETDYVEPVGNGYAPIALTERQWGILSLQGRSVAATPQQVFTLSGPMGPAYGYFLTNEDGLVCAERFGAKPYIVRKMGDQIKITPEVVLASK